MDKIEQAMERLKKGYNCTQCVLMAYSDELGLDEKTAKKIAEGFGGGMGNYRGPCGALSAVIMAAGLIKDENTETKQDTYNRVKEIRKEYAEKAGAEFCRDIRKPESGVRKMTCEECIKQGILMVGNLIKGE